MPQVRDEARRRQRVAPGGHLQGPLQGAAHRGGARRHHLLQTHALQDEQPEDAARGRPERDERSDVADLLHHHQDQGRHDVQRRDQHDQADHDEHQELFPAQGREQALVLAHQVADEEILAEGLLDRRLDPVDPLAEVSAR